MKQFAWTLLVLIMMCLSIWDSPNSEDGNLLVYSIPEDSRISSGRNSNDFFSEFFTFTGGIIGKQPIYM